MSSAVADRGLRRVAANALWLFLAEVANKAANLGLVVVIARGLSAESYGYFNFSISFVPLFLIFANWGMDSALVREVAKDRRRAQELLASAVTILGALGGAGLAVSFGAALFFVPTGTPYAVLVLVGLALFVDAQAALVGTVFQAFERMQFQAAVIATNRIVSTALALGAVLLGAGFLTVGLAYLLGSLAALVLALALAERGFGGLRPTLARRNAIRMLFARGLPLGLAAFLNMAVFRLDAVMLQGLRNATAVAYYGIGYRFFESFLFPSWILGDATLPRMSRFGSSHETRRTFELAVAVLLAVLLPVVVAFAFAGRWVVVTLFSAKLEPAAPVVPVLAGATVLYGLAHVSRIAHVALGKRRAVAQVAAVAVAVNVGLNAYAIPRWSYKGAAWTTLATEVLEAVLLLAGVTRLIGLPRPGKAAAVPVALAGAAAVVLGALDLHGGYALLLVAAGYPPLLALTAVVVAPTEVRRATRLLSRGRVGSREAAQLEVP